MGLQGARAAAHRRRRLPADYAWQWPASFIDIYSRHLAEAGKVDPAWADKVKADFKAAERDPNAAMVTPMVLEVIAEKA